MNVNIHNNFATKTVLVAEDEEYNFLYIEEMLSGLNVNILHAKNGKESIEIFNRNPQINLVLMDIKMPIMDGETAAYKIRQSNPLIPIIAQTAYAMEHERVRYQGSFDDYITKPIEEGELLICVKKYLGLS